MIRLISSSFFFLFCFTFAFVLTGCNGIGFSDSPNDGLSEQVGAGADADGFAPDEESANDETEQGNDSSDETSDDSSPDAAPEDDETDDGFVSECLFGSSIGDMGEAEYLQLGDFEHVLDTHELSDLEVDQLLNGFSAHGPSAIEDVNEMFDHFVDDGRVMVRTVLDVESDRAYTHLAFWSQGSEKGYIFFKNTLRLMAAVDGGTIYDCVVGF